MTSNLGKVLAGAVALAIGGTAAASTTPTAGDLYLNIVAYSGTSDGGNYNPTTSYLADLGLSVAAFNPATSYTFTLSGDSNLTSAYTTSPTALLDYSVVGENSSGTGSSKFHLDTTTNVSPTVWSSVVSKSNENNAIGVLQGGTSVISSATLTNSFSTGPGTVSSGILSGGGWGAGGVENSWTVNSLNSNTQPGIDSAAEGTALNFYQESAGITTYAGTWLLQTVAGVTTLTWNPTSSGGGGSVPLPTPVLLLLSGLGLMGVVARRGKSSERTV
jgi:hypothetical protein